MPLRVISAANRPAGKPKRDAIGVNSALFCREGGRMKGVSFTVEELEQRSGVQARTLRSWIREKVLPKPMGRGRGARYDERHVVRAVVARQLRSTKLSLPAIRTRLASMSESELVALAQSESRARGASVDGVPAPPPAPSYPSTAWEVVSLMDGLVLMVSTTKGPLVRRVADEIYRYYGSPM